METIKNILSYVYAPFQYMGEFLGRVVQYFMGAQPRQAQVQLSYVAPANLQQRVPLVERVVEPSAPPAIKGSESVRQRKVVTQVSAQASQTQERTVERSGDKLTIKTIQDLGEILINKDSNLKCLDIRDIDPKDLIEGELLRKIAKQFPNLKELHLGRFITRIRDNDLFDGEIQCLENIEILRIEKLEDNSLLFTDIKSQEKTLLPKLKKVFIKEVRNKLIICPKKSGKIYRDSEVQVVIDSLTIDGSEDFLKWAKNFNISMVIKKLNVGGLKLGVVQPKTREDLKFLAQASNSDIETLDLWGLSIEYIMEHGLKTDLPNLLTWWEFWQLVCEIICNAPQLKCVKLNEVSTHGMQPLKSPSLERIVINKLETSIIDGVNFSKCLSLSELIVHNNKNKGYVIVHQNTRVEVGMGPPLQRVVDLPPQEQEQELNLLKKYGKADMQGRFSLAVETVEELSELLSLKRIYKEVKTLDGRGINPKLLVEKELLSKIAAKFPDLEELHLGSFIQRIENTSLLDQEIRSLAGSLEILRIERLESNSLFFTDQKTCKEKWFSNLEKVHVAEVVNKNILFDVNTSASITIGRLTITDWTHLWRWIIYTGGCSKIETIGNFDFSSVKWEEIKKELEEKRKQADSEVKAFIEKLKAKTIQFPDNVPVDVITPSRMGPTHNIGGNSYVINEKLPQGNN